MRVRNAVLVVLLLVAGLTSCSDDGSDGDRPSSAPSASAEPLPSGKSDLALAAGTYRSPAGFRPALEVEVPTGWTSIHRGADAFDLGKPDPARDAPLVAVVVLRPSQETADAALAAVEDALAPTATPVQGTLAGEPARGLEVTGGHGQVLASADGGIALDAAPGQRLRVLAADVGGDPLLVVVLVPDGDHADAAMAAAQDLIDAISPG